MNVTMNQIAPNKVIVTESNPNIIQVTSSALPATKILSGNVVPVLSIGKVGDFYLHLVTAQLYGPKTSTSWGSPLQLGSIGPTGNSGVYVGPTPPIDTSLLWVDTSP